METLIISSLFVYGVCILITETDGPFGIFYKLKERIESFDCFMCLSVWVGAFASAFTARHAVDWMIHTFVISGAAIFIYNLRHDG